jgi:hypothetical protein
VNHLPDIAYIALVRHGINAEGLAANLQLHEIACSQPNFEPPARRP